MSEQYELTGYVNLIAGYIIRAKQRGFDKPKTIRRKFRYGWQVWLVSQDDPDGVHWRSAIFAKVTTLVPNIENAINAAIDRLWAAS